MDFAEQLRVLQAAQGHPAKLALATVDFTYPDLPDAERAALRSSLEAAAIPHWCDETILSVLLDIPKQESAVRLARLGNLSVVEPFPARGGNAVNVHEATRLVLRKRMAKDEQALFQMLGARATACFADDPTPAGWIEWVYHLLCSDPEEGFRVLETLSREGSNSVRSEDEYALEMTLNELVATGLVADRALNWTRRTIARTCVSRGKTVQFADTAAEAPNLAAEGGNKRLDEQNSSKGNPILVAVDLIERSTACLRHSCKMAVSLGYPLIIVHVAYETAETAGMYRRYNKRGDTTPILDIARTMLEEFVAEFREFDDVLDQVCDVELIVVDGIPETRILELAERYDASMIVMLSRYPTRWGLRSWFRRSVTKSVELNASRPVVVLGQDGNLFSRSVAQILLEKLLHYVWPNKSEHDIRRHKV